MVICHVRGGQGVCIRPVTILASFVHANAKGIGGNVFAYPFVPPRSAVHGHSDCLYAGETDWLNRKIWHPAQGGTAFDLAHYLYLNGRPSRMELGTLASDGQSLVSTQTYYLQYNWHGDAVTAVISAGNDLGTSNGWGAYDSWGNPANPCLYGCSQMVTNYYQWNGGIFAITA